MLKYDLMVQFLTKSHGFLTLARIRPFSSLVIRQPHVQLKNITYDPNVNSKRYKRKLVFKTWPIDNLPIKWERPPKKDCIFDTGDQVKNLDVDLNLPKPFFEDSEELKTADELVKKVFSLATANKSDIMYQKIRETVKKFQRHEYDFNSLDVKVAVLTLKIRNLQEWFAANNYEIIPCKRAVKEFSEKRYKYLNTIRKFDRERFNYLVKELGIDFEEPSQQNPPQQYTRKKAIKQLILEHCDQIKQEKLQAYKAKLESQKKDFLKEKEETLKWIEAEEKILADYEAKTGTKIVI